MPPSILTLPPETLDNIGQCIHHKQTWDALRLTCRTLADATKKAWADRFFNRYTIELDHQDLFHLAEFGMVEEIAKSIRTLNVICWDDRQDPCGQILPMVHGSPSDDEASNLTDDRLRVLLKALEPLRNIHTLAFLPDMEDLEREDCEDEIVFRISETFGMVLWALEILNIRPKKVIAGDFSNHNELVGLVWCHLLPHLNRSLSAVETFHINLLLDQDDPGGGYIGRTDITQISNSIRSGLDHMVSLKTLKLSFGQSEPRSLFTFMELADNVHLPRLVDVEFTALHCFAADLANFIEMHNATLKRLRLCWASFVGSESVTPSQMGHGGFHGVVQCLRQCDQLEYYRTACILSDGNFLLFPGMNAPSCRSELNEDGYVEVTVNGHGMGVVELVGRAEVKEGLPRVAECLHTLPLT